jgi:hypothetical protein
MHCGQQRHAAPRPAWPDASGRNAGRGHRLAPTWRRPLKLGCADAGPSAKSSRLRRRKSSAASAPPPALLPPKPLPPTLEKLWRLDAWRLASGELLSTSSVED